MAAHRCVPGRTRPQRLSPISPGNRVFPLAIIPNTDPAEAAAEVRRCARMGLRGGDLAFKRMTPPRYTHEWYPLWEAAAECRFPISFHSTGFKALRAPDTPEMEKKYFTQWRLVRSALFQLDTMEVLVSLLASGACEKYPDFNFVLGRIQGDVAALRLRPARHRICRPREEPQSKLKPSDYFRRQGYVTYQQDRVSRSDHPADRRGTSSGAADYPHPDCIWPNSLATLDRNLAPDLPERAARSPART
jgi:hypothetical protein